jgi:hypothetical protein
MRLLPPVARAWWLATLLVAPLADAPKVARAAAPPSATRSTPRSSRPPSAARAIAHRGPRRSEIAFLDTLERRTFFWFWDLSDARTGLTPDRAPTHSFASISATGFALTAYPIGVERKWIGRPAARARVLATLRFFWTARQDTAAQGSTGYRGFFYHFLDPASGTRFEKVELSTIDTALLLAGVLFCQSYFDRAEAEEAEIRALADSIYARADWSWAQVRPPMVSHGWDPERGFLPYDWRGYNESMLVPLLAIASPTHPLSPATWSNWASGCTWGRFEGYEHVGFAPLFGHQYPMVWLDLRGVRDSLMSAHGIDWFENSRRATLAQHTYAVENPSRFRGYGTRLWGLSACDGPLDQTLTIAGKAIEFHTYAARGASYTRTEDDGTVTPTAAGGSIAFAPEVAIPTLIAMRQDWGRYAWNRYGFVDALNPTLTLDVSVHHGRVVKDVGWFDVDQLGIDQGPILAMIENYRTGLVWRVMRRNPHIVRGLTRAGFRGGWLDAEPKSR